MLASHEEGPEAHLFILLCLLAAIAGQLAVEFLLADERLAVLAPSTVGGETSCNREQSEHVEALRYPIGWMC